MDDFFLRGFRANAEGIGSVHEGRSARQPYMYEESEGGSTSSADYLATPDSSQKARTVHEHRYSDPIRPNAYEFHHPARPYPPSEPSPQLHGRCPNCNKKNEELRACRRQLKESQAESQAAQKTAAGENKVLKTQLFHCHKAAKRHEEAETFYRMIVTEDDTGNTEDPAILDIKYSFAEMLIGQKRYEEAELTSRAVWDKRKVLPDSEEFKNSHRQLCSILEALRRFSEAEDMHRSMYRREPKDSWALENGDAVCNTMAAQGQYDQAQLEQDKVWKERQKHHTPRHELTIRSGLRRMALLEILAESTDNPGVSDTEKRLSNHRKQVFKYEMEVMLMNIWDKRQYPEPNTDILDAGHKLGQILFDQAKYDRCEPILSEVWEGRKQRFGDGDISAMCSGSLVGKCLLQKGSPEAYSRAVEIFHSIWLARQAILERGSVDTLSSGEDLAHAYLKLEDWRQAEVAYAWVVDQNVKKYGKQAPQTVDAYWNLGQALFYQGHGKDREAEGCLGAAYHQLSQTAPHAKATLKCGHMLAELLQPQIEKANNALQLIRDVFSRREASIERDVDYLDSGRLYGWLLLDGGDIPEAERVLKGLWEYEAKGPDEKKMRLKCGQLYGDVLYRQQKYTEAKEVLGLVAEGQETSFPAGGPEADETSKLLKEVNDRCKEIESKEAESKETKKRNKGRRRPWVFS